jgi:Virulence-associated protein E/Primase C terminal 2 (PriCT-2)/RepB DNA-primase from phage plasmid
MLATAAFLAFVGPSAYCALWPVKQLGECPRKDANGRPVNAIPLGYGPWTPALEKRCQELNATGYGIYFTPNDPGSADRHEKNFRTLRCIYRECDTSPDPCQLGGELPHLHWESSPGKSQSLWLTEDLPAERSARIHAEMVNLYGHDSNSSGAGRLLRLPGFANTKYPSRPLARVTMCTQATQPRLAAARVLKTLGCDPRPEALDTDRRPGDQNLGRFANAAFSSTGGGATSTLYAINQAQPARTARSPELEAGRLQRSVGMQVGYPTATLIAALARIPADERAVWFRIGASLHFTFDGADDGLYLWREWSRTSSAYKPGDCDREWRGFTHDRDAKASLRTILMEANRHPADAAALDRRAALDEVALVIGQTIRIQILAAMWPETEASGDGSRTLPVALSAGNGEYALDMLAPDLYWDEFAGEKRRASGPWRDIDETLVYHGAVAEGWKCSKAWVRECAEVYAVTRSRDPLLDYFNGRRGAWDGVPRLETFIIRHLGAPDTRVNREITTLLFVAMVRRALDPGYKFDMLTILKGKQNLGKSSLFRRICPDVEWFSDAPDLNEDAKRFYPALQGKLIIEFAELSGKSKGDIERIKKIVTQQRDEYTAMYGRHMTRSPRRCVFIGTTNEDVFLRDPTGNRRFPVIECTKAFDARAVDAEREQIWAEAVHMDELYRQCDAYLELSDESAAEMERVQAEYVDLDPGVQEVLDQLDALGSGCVGNDALYEALGHKSEDKKSRHGGRVGAIMKTLKSLLKREGWATLRQPRRIAGKMQRGLIKFDPHGVTQDIICGADGTLQHHDP